MKAESAKLKDRVRSGTSLDDILVEAFAIASEAASRVLGMRPYDVQMMAAAAIHDGNMVEMQTGEEDARSGDARLSECPAR